MLAYAKQLRPSSRPNPASCSAWVKPGRKCSQVMHDLRNSQCRYSHAGPISRPSQKHLPVIRYVPQDEFDDFKRVGYASAFRMWNRARSCAAPITPVTRSHELALSRRSSHRTAAAVRTGDRQSLSGPLGYGWLLIDCGMDTPTILCGARNRLAGFGHRVDSISGTSCSRICIPIIWGVAPGCRSSPARNRPDARSGSRAPRFARR